MRKIKYFHVRAALKRMCQSSFCSAPVALCHPGNEYGVVVTRDFGNTVIAGNGSVDPINLYGIIMKSALTINAAMNIKYDICLLSKLRGLRDLVADHNEIVRFVMLRDSVLCYSTIVNGPQLGARS